ncbi:HEAT repeat domain-containing protein [Mucilaginibacter sp. CSA2-8R]|uniref:HEAT repeat domain-containing protein n=1 Tax=Mucilaginibacter sp. CSA2-8R TaxID=3141542 RepID=UPI00315DFBFA
MNGQNTDYLCEQALTQLKQAVINGETFFIKVHAAENLIRHQQTGGLESEFLKLKTASPDNVIGSTRVLARLSKLKPAQYQQYISQLLQQFEHGPSAKIQLTALESLGKLGYYQPLAMIKSYADTGTNGFKGMARWILANSGKIHDEDRLSELLLSDQEIDYRYAAYALRFKTKINALTINRLKTCLQNLNPNDAARVYVASCLFVHNREADKEQGKPILLSYLKGEVGQRYELAEALGLGGNQQDLPLLMQLMADENTDVRVAASNAILNIKNCKI